MPDRIFFTRTAPDPRGVDSHRSFADHRSLNFTLVADGDKVVSRLYETVGILGVNRRVTCLTDPEGQIAGMYRSEARPRSHVEWARGQLFKPIEPEGLD